MLLTRLHPIEEALRSRPRSVEFVLVDTGLIDTTPEINGDGEEWHPHPLPDELVSRVALVVNTHLHFDHCGSNHLFPHAPIYVQEAEYTAAHSLPHFTILPWVDFPGARYAPISGEQEILPGVRLLPTAGHTPGHQSVALETERGLVVLAGQAIYSTAEYRHVLAMAQEF